MNMKAESFHIVPAYTQIMDKKLICMNVELNVPIETFCQVAAMLKRFENLNLETRLKLYSNQT